MKIRVNKNNIELSNISKTVFGIILAIIYPVFLLLCILDDYSKSVDNFQIVQIIILTFMYSVWLCTGFKNQILPYKIYIDQNGIVEKRLIGKDKVILWDNLEEYICEATPPAHRTQQKFYKIIFYSKGDKCTIIKTQSFSESKKSFYQEPIFSICDKYFNNAN